MISRPPPPPHAGIPKPLSLSAGVLMYLLDCYPLHAPAPAPLTPCPAHHAAPPISYPSEHPPPIPLTAPAGYWGKGGGTGATRSQDQERVGKRVWKRGK